MLLYTMLTILTTGSKVAVDSSSLAAASSPAGASVVSSFGGSVVAAASCSSLMVKDSFCCCRCGRFRNIAREIDCVQSVVPCFRRVMVNVAADGL